MHQPLLFEVSPTERAIFNAYRQDGAWALLVRRQGAYDGLWYDAEHYEHLSVSELVDVVVATLLA